MPWLLWRLNKLSDPDAKPEPDELVTTIVKLGGSQLTNPNWPTQLAAWFRSQPIDRYLVLIGGGRLIEAVREIDSISIRVAADSMRPMGVERRDSESINTGSTDTPPRTVLDPTLVHWLCIDLMNATFEVAAALLPDITALRDPDSLSTWLTKTESSVEKSLAIVRVASFYNRSTEEQLRAMDAWPTENWRTTSDSCAVILARLVAAERIVLIKSVSVAEGMDASTATAEQLVDDSLSDLMDSQIQLEFQCFQHG
jgi:aspartokinase-like uncharacterized kinase